MTRTLLVSNRLPITVRVVSERSVIAPTSGGLGTTLDFVHRRGDGLWFGTAHEDLEREYLEQRRLVAVDLSREVVERFYDGYSNQALWPVFHYRTDLMRAEPQDFHAYAEANERFAEQIAARWQPGDRIWINDYHFMLLPAILRQRLPDASIGFFLHVPFPAWQVFRVLPRRAEILRGILGADVIGLHTPDYAKNLATALRRCLATEVSEEGALRAGGRDVRIVALPLGIDAASSEARARVAEAGPLAQALRKRFGGRRVILGVERLDYIKGVPLRLRAYRRLLERSPRWRSDAVYVQVAEPSRGAIATYRDLQTDVDQMIAGMNRELAVGDVAPIEYRSRWVPPEELTALFCVADVCWVSSVRDGMNMVAKEYIAHCVDGRGSLVLSEFAGASVELTDAILHHPWDLDASADAVERALLIEPAEEMRRMAALRHQVREFDIERWADRFLAALHDRGAAP